MFKHILVPTDGSEFSEKIIKNAMTLAKTLNAKVTSVHVVPATYHIYYGEVGPVAVRSEAELQAADCETGNKYLDRIEAAAKSAGVVFSRVLIGSDNPWEGIIEAARKQNCDMIMMAAHGRRGLSALLLGSETHKVLTHSKIPVLVYR